MLKGLLQSELFYCNHLGASENDEKDIMKFSIDRDEGSGLLEYLQNYALTEEENGIMRTYIVRDKISSEVAGYFSLKALASLVVPGKLVGCIGSPPSIDRPVI